MLDKGKEFFLCSFKDAKTVINVSEPKYGLVTVGVYKCSFKPVKESYGKPRTAFASHAGTLNLHKMFTIEFEVAF